MTKTEHYQLPQWAANDPVRREAFNQAMENIDAGITAAQEAAETAQGTAAAARSEAAALPYVVGSYTGTGAELTITLGFQPRFLIISGMQDTLAGNSTLEWDRSFGLTAGNAIPHRLKLTSTGFVVYPQDYAHYYYPNFTEEGRVYDYIAFT